MFGEDRLAQMPLSGFGTGEVEHAAQHFSGAFGTQRDDRNYVGGVVAGDVCFHGTDAHVRHDWAEPFANLIVAPPTGRGSAAIVRGAAHTLFAEFFRQYPQRRWTRGAVWARHQ